MPRLFGTDGARGVANEEITAELAMKIGRATAAVLTDGHHRRNPRVIVGKDTRISSDMLEASITAGLCSVGADVISLGVVPTPACAWLIKHYKADAGVMISASHNTYEYNGIKIFDGEGFKLPDELEEKIENLIFDETEHSLFLAKKSKIGTASAAKDSVRAYAEHLKSTLPTSLEGIKIALDCANGSASRTAETLFGELGANIEIINSSPNGININENCGSTHIAGLCEKVKNGGFSAGAAFDGDADRCLLVDEKGNVIDGDVIMAICALDLKKRGKLRRNTLVGTVMANMGLNRFCDEQGIRFIPTKVGDRYVLEEMELGDYRFGGEQSGHIIFRDFATTGDGQLTAAQVFCHLLASGKPLSELAGVIKKYPQSHRNIPVDADGKLRFYGSEIIKSLVSDIKADLGESGRAVVRVSGTEPLIRVMLEGEDERVIDEYADNLAEVISSQVSGDRF